MVATTNVAEGPTAVDPQHGPDQERVREAVRRAMDVCPVEVAITVLGGAWKMTIVKNLIPGALRFGALRRAVGPVSERTLTRQVRELERDGVLHRKVFAEVPPRVEYSLSELGSTLLPLVSALDDWGADYLRRAGSDRGAGARIGAYSDVGVDPDAAVAEADSA